jgi:hypothetical protein
VDEVARWAARDRADLFTEAASKLGLHPAILEKDFWVCWTLKRLFDLQDSPPLVFKGGTSLSKVYSVIRRFSEDIDLSFDRRYFGYENDRDPAKAPTNKGRDRLLDEMSADVERHIETALIPQLAGDIGSLLGTDAVWKLTKHEKDAKNVVFQYPPSLTGGTLDYVRPAVLIELGARGDPWPTETRSIIPYAAQERSDVFRDPVCNVVVLEAKRTFWEKATILHALFHRPPGKAVGERHSRHYYDLALLAPTEHGERALAEPALLGHVAKHKSVYFAQASARYDLACPGTLRLVPSGEQLEELSSDYSKMSDMIFDRPPPKFSELLLVLIELEKKINGTSDVLPDSPPIRM